MTVISTGATATFQTKESRTFTYPSRVSDLYNPVVEAVVEPSEQYPSYELKVVAEDGITSAATKSRKQQFFSSLSAATRRLSGETISVPDKLIFDARYEPYNNVSHLMHNVLIPLLYIRKRVLNTQYTTAPLLTIVGQNAGKHVLEAFSLLGLEVMVSDASIEGHIVRLDRHFDHKLFSLIPDVLSCDVVDKPYDGPKRVFVPRRGDRALTNQSEISSFLEQYGFETLYFEDLTIEQEWQIARNIECAVVVHGAAWSHFVWSKPGAKFIDIKSPAFSLKLVSYLSTMVGADYCSVRGRVTPDTLKALDFSRSKNIGPHWSPYKDAFEVDSQSIKRALDYVGFFSRNDA